jgi:hypothetical protein
MAAAGPLDAPASVAGRPRRRRELINSSKCSMVQLAVENNDQRLVVLLLRYGSCLFVRDARGYTALHSAALLGRSTCALMLLRKTRLQPWREELELLGREQVLSGCLALAARQGHATCVALLVRFGADPAPGAAAAALGPLARGHEVATLPRFDRAADDEEGEESPQEEQLQPARPAPPDHGGVMHVLRIGMAACHGHSWEVATTRKAAECALQWQKLATLCRRPQSALSASTGLPAEVLNQIVLLL